MTTEIVNLVIKEQPVPEWQEWLGPKYISEHRIDGKRYPTFDVPHSFAVETNCLGFVEVPTVPRRDEEGKLAERVSKMCRVCDKPVNVALTSLRPYHPSYL